MDISLTDVQKNRTMASPSIQQDVTPAVYSCPDDVDADDGLREDTFPEVLAADTNDSNDSDINQHLQDTQIELSLAAGEVDLFLEAISTEAFKSQHGQDHGIDRDASVVFPAASQDYLFSQQLAHLWQVSRSPVLCAATPQSQCGDLSPSPQQRCSTTTTNSHNTERGSTLPDFAENSVDESGSSASESVQMPSPSQSATQLESAGGVGFRSPRQKRRRVSGTPTKTTTINYICTSPRNSLDFAGHGNVPTVSQSQSRTTLSPLVATAPVSALRHVNQTRDVPSSFETCSMGDDDDTDFLALTPQRQDPLGSPRGHVRSNAMAFGSPVIMAPTSKAVERRKATYSSTDGNNQPVLPLPDHTWMPRSRTLGTLARHLTAFGRHTANPGRARDPPAASSAAPHSALPTVPSTVPPTVSSAATAALLGVVVQVDAPRMVQTKHGPCPVASVRLSDPSTPQTLLLTVWGSRARSAVVARLALGDIVYVGGFRLSTYHGAVGANLSSTNGWLRVLAPTHPLEPGSIRTDTGRTGQGASALPRHPGGSETDMLAADVGAVHRWKAVRYPWITPVCHPMTHPFYWCRAFHDQRIDIDQ